MQILFLPISTGLPYCVGRPSLCSELEVSSGASRAPLARIRRSALALRPPRQGARGRPVKLLFSHAHSTVTLKDRPQEAAWPDGLAADASRQSRPGIHRTYSAQDRCIQRAHIHDAHSDLHDRRGARDAHDPDAHRRCARGHRARRCRPHSVACAAMRPRRTHRRARCEEAATRTSTPLPSCLCLRPTSDLLLRGKLAGFMSHECPIAQCPIARVAHK